jgi:hypothetical protein
MEDVAIDKINWLVGNVEVTHTGNAIDILAFIFIPQVVLPLLGQIYIKH